MPGCKIKPVSVSLPVGHVESLKRKPDNKVIVYNPGEYSAEKETGSVLEPDFGMVETGES